MSITATVEHDTIRLPEGVHLPDGTQVRIVTVDAQPARSLADRYSSLVGIADDLPKDMARNLDHYVHGHPRKP